MAIDPVSAANAVINNPKVSNTINQIKTPIQDKIVNNSFAKKIINLYDPTGANNTFAGLTTLMFATVILPRVLTAKKRNPDNKEATSDEIKEILFRDIQTVGIILFALKVLDALIGRGVSKLQGIPLTNKAFKNVFGKDPNLKFTDRVRNAFDNIKDTFNPTGGLVKYSNAEIVAKYSNYNSIEEVQKLFKELPAQGGDNQKVYSKIMNSLIENQQKLIASKESQKAGGINVSVDKAKKVLEKLKDASNQSWETINDKDLDKDVAAKIVNFFKNTNNDLVKYGKKLSAWLKTIALGIEVSYLGFGLPALNQKRLEKKYLSEKDNIVKNQFHNAARAINSSVLVDKTIKPQEIALYHNFIK